MKKSQELDLEITDMAFGGRGFARVDGMAVFVDDALAGDHVRARIHKKKKRYAEGRILEILSPSPDRINAPCPYAAFCGGCKWQHLSYEKQLSYKTSHVGEALEHIAGISDFVLHPAIPSPSVFHYRNKMEFTCTESCWLPPEEFANPEIKKSSAVGLHVPGSFDRVLDIEKCFLQSEEANDVFRGIRREILASGLPMYGLKSHKGFWRFVVLRHSVAENSLMVNLVTSEENRDCLLPMAKRIHEEFPGVTSIVNNITARKAGVATGEKEVLLLGESVLHDTIGDFRFRISANSFFQTNTRGAAELYGKVAEYANLSGCESVLDLYSGTGTIGIYLSRTAKEVTGIEIVSSAVSDARINCMENGIENCRFIEGDMKDVVSNLDKRPDLIVLDPPRAGMHPDVVAKILSLAPEKMVYVSCNPATMARDLAMMKGVYRVEEVQPVDMFPHTYHIEAVARLAKYSC